MSVDGQFLQGTPPLFNAMTNFAARLRGPRNSHQRGEIHGLALVIGTQYRQMKVGDMLQIPVVKPTRWISWTVDTDPPVGTVALKMEHAVYEEDSERMFANVLGTGLLTCSDNGVEGDVVVPAPGIIYEWDQKDLIRLTVKAIGNGVERAFVGLYVYELPNPIIRSSWVLTREGDIVTNNEGVPLTA